MGSGTHTTEVMEGGIITDFPNESIGRDVLSFPVSLRSTSLDVLTL